MANYRDDRKWSDIWIPQIKRIVGPRLMSITPDEIDCNQAADLWVFTARDMRIAARVRRPGFSERYPFQFTVRAKRDSGATTELSKIVDGWGDWMFYGHSDAEQKQFALWWLIDLHAFRASLIRQGTGNIRLSYGNQANGDGTHFKWFDLRSFPEHPAILVDGSMNLPSLDAVTA